MEEAGFRTRTFVNDDGDCRDGVGNVIPDACCATWFVCNFVCKLPLPAMSAYPAKADEFDPQSGQTAAY